MAVTRIIIDTTTIAGTTFIGKAYAPANIDIVTLQSTPVWSIKKIVASTQTIIYLPSDINGNASIAPNFKWSERNTLITYL